MSSGLAIETQDLRKTYRVGKVEVPALRGADLQVRTGEFLAIVGPSGSGKSTLFHIIGGLTPPTAGRVQVAGLDLATRVSTPTAYEWTHPVAPCSPSDLVGKPAQPKYHVVAYDYGIKHNILRRLAHVGCRVTVVPSLTSAEDVLALNPDGVFLSNGPGDPEPLQPQVANIRKLIGKKPIFGICLGNQLLGLAAGGRTYKLKFGHRGANHPVRNEITQKVEITSHNHGFAVDPDSLNQNDVEITHVNLNDQTLEGFRFRNHPVFCVQYHPEAAPGPHDSHYLFNDFVKLMSQNSERQ